MLKRLAVSAACALAAASSTAHAQALFQINASSSTTTVSAGGSNLINLATNLANNTQQFAPLQNQSFTSSLNYAGIHDAIGLDQTLETNGNKVLTVNIPSVGVTQTFNSANGSLSSQLRNYFKHNGLADLTAFQAVVTKLSPAGVVDGNPLATTTLLQDAGYEEFGLHANPIDTDGQRFVSNGGHVANRFWVDAGVLDAGGISGDYVNFTYATELYFNDYVGLTFTTPLRYQTLHSASIYMGGEVIGVPIMIIPAKGGPVSWQVTPAAHAGAVGSEDLVSGGLMYGGQITSSLSLSVNTFTFTLADQAGYYHGANLDISGYSFNTHLNDWIFKNGLQVSKSFGNLFVDASGSWTNFTRDVYTQGYFTPELGIGFKFGGNNSCGLRLGYIGNYGDHYNTTGGNVLLYVTR